VRRKVLITGGAGFIGSHLADALLARGDAVRVIDDLSTGSIENIEHLKSHPRFSYVIDTVMNRPLMAELIDWSDMVFHLAAAVGVRLIVDRPVHTIETNIRTTEIVLELAARKGRPVLLTSTSEVYGKLTREYFSEEDDLVLGPTSRARWCYAASKIIDEFLAKAYFTRREDCPWSSSGSSTPSGPGRRGNMAWWYPALCARPWRVSPSRCTETGLRGGRSPGWAMWLTLSSS